MRNSLRLKGGLFIKKLTMVPLMAILALTPLAPLFAVQSAEALTPVDVLFEDGFETGDFSEWDNSGASWTVVNNGPQAFEGTHYARQEGDTDVSLTKTTEIETVGHENINLSFQYKRSGLEDIDFAAISYGPSSFDTSTEYIYGESGTSDDDTDWQSFDLDLGPSVEGLSAMYLSILVDSGADSGETFRIDDLKITGEAIPATDVTNIDTGETFATIQAAIDDSDTVDGHTIVVSDGIYNENVSIDKEITLKSENGAASTTIAPTSGRAINLLGQLSNLDGVTIEGFTINGVSGQITVQANSQASDGYDYTDLTYRNLFINANGGFGLGLFDVNGATLDNVTIIGASNGIEAVGLAGLDLKNSSISGSSGVGLNVFAASGYEVNSNLSITNTDFSSNSTGLELVDAGNVEINGGVVDGGTFGVISSGSNTVIDGTTFQNIYPSNYSGVAVAGLGGTVAGGFGAGTHAANELTVKNSTFANIGRIGVLAKGDSSNLAVENITYTGKGVVDGIDYAVEFGAGATGNVTDSTVTNNLGTASSDGSTSAGVLVTDFYGNGTEAEITKNNFSNNTSAIAIGYNASDASKVVAQNNNITDNDNGIVNSSALADVNATENWWGEQDGPSGEGPGTGDSVDTDVSYSPWLCGPFETNPSTTTDGNCSEDSSGSSDGGSETGGSSTPSVVTVASAQNDSTPLPIFAAQNTGGSDEDETSEEEGEVLQSSTDESDENDETDVLASEEQTDEEATCSEILGVCWYWWIPVAIIVGYVVYRRMRQGEEV